MCTSAAASAASASRLQKTGRRSWGVHGKKYVANVHAADLCSDGKDATLEVLELTLESTLQIGTAVSFLSLHSTLEKGRWDELDGIHGLTGFTRV